MEDPQGIQCRLEYSAKFHQSVHIWCWKHARARAHTSYSVIYKTKQTSGEGERTNKQTKTWDLSSIRCPSPSPIQLLTTSHFFSGDSINTCLLYFPDYKPLQKLNRTIKKTDSMFAVKVSQSWCFSELEFAVFEIPYNLLKKKKKPRNDWDALLHFYLIGLAN